MRTIVSACARTLQRRTFLASLAWAALAAISTSQATAQQIDRVEEDWELVVAEPDLNKNSPQITTVISPLGHVDGLHAAFDLNHQSQFTYGSGGMQLQLWSAGEALAYRDHANGAALADSNETVRWTQAMELNHGLLKFEIINGSSTTWPGFGGASLRLSTNTSLDSLDAYDPQVSLDNSGVGFASNRVTHLKLVCVRRYAQGELISEDSSEHVIHTLDGSSP